MLMVYQGRNHIISIHNGESRSAGWTLLIVGKGLSQALMDWVKGLLFNKHKIDLAALRKL